MKKPVPDWARHGIVLQWKDGDTVKVALDLGLSLSAKLVCRLSGIQAPEKTGPTKASGVASWNRARELAPPGSDVVVRTVKSDDPGEKYGRWLAEIWPAAGEESVNEILLREGLAVPYPARKPAAPESPPESSVR